MSSSRASGGWKAHAASSSVCRSSWRGSSISSAASKTKRTLSPSASDGAQSTRAQDYRPAGRRASDGAPSSLKVNLTPKRGGKMRGCSTAGIFGESQVRRTRRPEAPEVRLNAG